MVTLSGNSIKLWQEFSSPPIQPFLFGDGHQACSILRLDLIKSWASGNKYFKLKYTLLHVLQMDIPTIVSKGGMFSNHLAALAEACAVFGKQFVAVIRSHAPDDRNPSILKLKELGAEIIYLAPGSYTSFDQHEAEKLINITQMLAIDSALEQYIQSAAKNAQKNNLYLTQNSKADEKAGLLDPNEFYKYYRAKKQKVAKRIIEQLR